MTDPGTTLGDVIHQRTADLTRIEFDAAVELLANRRRISALKHLREGYARDDRETLQGAGEPTP